MFKSSVLLVLLAASDVYCNVTSICGKKEICDTYLDLAVDMIVRAKHNIPTCPKIRPNVRNGLSESTFVGAQPLDCADLFLMDYNKSGIYEIWPVSRLTGGKPVNVYCDMDTDGGGWTVIQRRGDFASSKDYFSQNWENYKKGFGDLEKDFWLGNDNIFALTNQKLYSARFDLMDVEQNKAFADCDKFWTDDENHKYTLHIYLCRGNAGDSMTAGQNNRQFSTKDHDNDNQGMTNLAEHLGGGWWFGNWPEANLNGLYLKGKHGDPPKGVIWSSWKGKSESLEWTEIKVRPQNFNKPSFASEETLS